MKIICLILSGLFFYSCTDDQALFNSSQINKNELYFREFFIAKNNVNDTLLSIAIKLDTNLFHYKIRKDIPIHFLIQRKIQENFIQCDLTYEWDVSQKVPRYFDNNGICYVTNLSDKPTGGIRSSRSGVFSINNGKVKLINNSLNHQPTGMINILGKKLKESSGQELIYTSYIMDSDSLYLITCENFN